MLPDLPYAYGKPVTSGMIRTEPTDFQVEEVLGFELSGEGEHQFVEVEKQSLTTEQLAKLLADFANVPKRQVSFSGMKDKHALTSQWFSIHMPGVKMLDWQGLDTQGIRIKQSSLHKKKLKRGVHKSNRFKITFRDWNGDASRNDDRVKQIRHQGVPNYFGEQRFGRNGDNIDQASRWFQGVFTPKRHLRSIYLSSARSYLFNLCLAQRVVDGSWNQLLNDEIVILDGSNSVFAYNEAQDLQTRLEQGDIHPTGPLYGKEQDRHGRATMTSQEREILIPHSVFTEGLIRQGLNAERRSLRLIAKDLVCEYPQDRMLVLSFELPKGCFATSLIREVVDYSVKQQ